MLASDLDNPEFAGPVNPDSMLSVEFYDYAALDKWETDKTGIKTYRTECPFVRISIPGNDKSIVERPAEGIDARRFPKQWLWYQMQTGKIANAENVPGWPLEQWEELNAEQVRQLKFLRFFTVEQIAGANDAQVQGIGMGGNSLRTKAQAAVAAKNGAEVKDEVAKRDSKIADLEDKLSRVMAVLEKLEPKKKAA
jgi:hypothetical protein